MAGPSPPAPLPMGEGSKARQSVVPAQAGTQRLSRHGSRGAELLLAVALLVLSGAALAQQTSPRLKLMLLASPVHYRAAPATASTAPIAFKFKSSKSSVPRLIAPRDMATPPPGIPGQTPWQSTPPVMGTGSA